MEGRGWHREWMDLGTVSPVPAGREHTEVTPQTAGAIPCLDSWRSLLNLLLIQHQQEFKRAPSYTSAAPEAPLLSSAPLPSQGSRLAGHTDTKALERKPASRRKVLLTFLHHL